MYTTTWCHDCRRTKQWFLSHKIAYDEINIEEREEAIEYIRTINKGLLSVPTIVFPDGEVLVEPTNQQLEAKLLNRLNS